MSSMLNYSYASHAMPCSWLGHRTMLQCCGPRIDAALGYPPRHDNERVAFTRRQQNGYPVFCSSSDKDYADVQSQPESLGSPFRLNYADNSGGKDFTRWGVIQGQRFNDTGKSQEVPGSGPMHLIHHHGRLGRGALSALEIPSCILQRTRNVWIHPGLQDACSTLDTACLAPTSGMTCLLER